MPAAQVLEISDVRQMFGGNRPDLQDEVAGVLAKAKKEAWNQLEKVEAVPGSYAHYDFLEDVEGFRKQHRVPCKDAMLTPEIRAVIRKEYGDDFTLF